MMELILFVIVLFFYGFFIKWITLYLWHGKSVIKSNAERALKTLKRLKGKVSGKENETKNNKIDRIKTWARNNGETNISEDTK
ncbi:MAG: hypothetical protein FXF54_00095 [Kosmotoga sp.]|nr:MAG: hypothetical protein FXF54_00095 [Kosmotoga sp.]